MLSPLNPSHSPPPLSFWIDVMRYLPAHNRGAAHLNAHHGLFLASTTLSCYSTRFRAAAGSAAAARYAVERLERTTVPRQQQLPPPTPLPNATSAYYLQHSALLPALTLSPLPWVRRWWCIVQRTAPWRCGSLAKAALHSHSYGLVDRGISYSTCYPSTRIATTASAAYASPPPHTMFHQHVDV